MKAPVPHRSWGLPVLIGGFAAIAVAGMGTTITEMGPWYATLVQPRWAPPEIGYSIAWTLIYLFTGLAAITGWRAMPTRQRGDWIVGLFALSGFLNILWSLLFFHVHRPDWALACIVPLWMAIMLWIYIVWPRSTAAGLLLLPYLACVTFAGYHTMMIVKLNGPFG
ncbi:TspO/MBR family protein [Sphingomonas sp. MMS24-J45]|uniref:TspO/MBR family protein n=1 Tax=Sphingomonas sp. MMS24-J45 TaxID=3238806 RepID=UPI00384F049F